MSEPKKTWADMCEADDKDVKDLSQQVEALRVDVDVNKQGDIKKESHELLDEYFKYEDNDHKFAQAFLDRLFRVLGQKPVPLTSTQTLMVTPSNRPGALFDPTRHLMNYHCGTYHWVSDCRARSTISVRSNKDIEVYFKMMNDFPHVGFNTGTQTEWFKGEERDKVAILQDLPGPEIKIKFKYMLIAKPI